MIIKKEQSKIIFFVDHSYAFVCAYYEVMWKILRDTTEQAQGHDWTCCDIECERKEKAKG